MFPTKKKERKFCIRFEFFSDENIQKFTANFGNNFQNLKQLKLDFEVTSSKAKSKYVNYPLMKDAITARGVRLIISIISLSPNSLRHFDLRFSGCDIDSKVLSWKTTQGKLTKLQSLNLDLSNCPQTDDNVVQGIGLWLHSRGKNIRNLELNFGRQKEYYLMGLKSLVSAFAVLTKLEHLTLVYSLENIAFTKIQELAPDFEQIFSRVLNIEILFVRAESPSEDFNETFKFAQILYANKCLKLTRK